MVQMMKGTPSRPHFFCLSLLATWVDRWEARSGLRSENKTIPDGSGYLFGFAIFVALEHGRGESESSTNRWR